MYMQLLFILCIGRHGADLDHSGGAFERVAEGKINRVVAGSFAYIEGKPQTPWGMLQCIYQGFINSANTIFMIFFCGAAINMLEETKSLSTAFQAMAQKLRGKEAISIAVIMFGLGLAIPQAYLEILALRSFRSVFSWHVLWVEMISWAF